MGSESERNLHQDQKQEISLFEGDDGFCIRTFLARKPSLNQSSELFYSESEAGIPFKWETEPGTPKQYIYPQEDGLITTPPLSPSPLMQSLKLRLPDHDEFKGSNLKSSKVESFKKMVQKSIASSRHRYQKERLRFGELMEFGKDSSVSSSSSSSFSIPWKDRGLDSSVDSMFGSGSCCRKGNVAGILLQDHEENKGIAIPREEMQPETPKCPRGNDDVIQPPPAVRSSYPPPPQPRDGGEKRRDSAWTNKALLWIKGSRGTRKTKKFDPDISFRCPENMEFLDPVKEFHDSLLRNMSKSSSSSKTNGTSYFSCGSWKGVKRDSCVWSKQI
ncbi:uncharacterized protein [Primulina huaijiensis]|uniref:uncharacterized protein n=1 Tax=Primulina huaijiensis TaxID=1492673 RepID=UPI003CC7687B